MLKHNVTILLTYSLRLSVFLAKGSGRRSSAEICSQVELAVPGCEGVATIHRARLGCCEVMDGHFHWVTIGAIGFQRHVIIRF